MNDFICLTVRQTRTIKNDQKGFKDNEEKSSFGLPADGKRVRVYAQNVTLAPEAGISAVQRYGWGQEWRPSAKVGVAADFNLTRHFGIESGLFYTFRGYSISNGGSTAMKTLLG